jgi:hypothetical protein
MKKILIKLNNIKVRAMYWLWDALRDDSSDIKIGGSVFVNLDEESRHYLKEGSYYNHR